MSLLNSSFFEDICYHLDSFHISAFPPQLKVAYFDIQFVSLAFLVLSTPLQ